MNAVLFLGTRAEEGRKKEGILNVVFVFFVFVKGVHTGSDLLVTYCFCC